MDPFLSSPETQEGDQSSSLVWIIDDDDVFQFILKESLKSVQITDVMTFDHGRSAFETLSKALHQHHNLLPRIIFLDIHMPTLDGATFLKLCDKLEPELRRKLPAIFLISTKMPEPHLKNHPLVKSFILKEERFSALKELIAQEIPKIKVA